MTNYEKGLLEDIEVRWLHHGDIKIGRVFMLAEMARNNIRPDGTFSDDECAIWLLFRS